MLKILFEDEHLIAFDKPTGMVVNRSETYHGETIQDHVEATYTLDDSGDFGENEEYAEEFNQRAGIVHRLDKDTSGVIIVAKTKTAFLELQKQFKSREVKKEYRAIAVGHGLVNQFEIDAPIDRNPRNRMTMAIVPQGNPAKTKFERLQQLEINGNPYTYLRVNPLTGRTHQIRVHLAALNHPVAGDPIYCSRVQFQQTSELFARMMLHALSIEFIHPVTGEPLKVTAELPDAFKKHVEEVGHTEK
jgi:23S rRNA pseudouridine1911/1915/1917 synthase